MAVVCCVLRPFSGVVFGLRGRQTRCAAARPQGVPPVGSVHINTTTEMTYSTEHVHVGTSRYLAIRAGHIQGTPCPAQGLALNLDEFQQQVENYIKNFGRSRSHQWAQVRRATYPFIRQKDAVQAGDAPLRAAG